MIPFRLLISYNYSLSRITFIVQENLNRHGIHSHASSLMSMICSVDQCVWCVAYCDALVASMICSVDQGVWCVAHCDALVASMICSVDQGVWCVAHCDALVASMEINRFIIAQVIVLPFHLSIRDGYYMEILQYIVFLRVLFFIVGKSLPLQLFSDGGVILTRFPWVPDTIENDVLDARTINILLVVEL